MKFSLNWVAEYAKGLKNLKIEEITAGLWGALAEIEGVEDLYSRYKNLKVAKVISKQKHPNSDKLYIAQLDLGDTEVTVVAGAGNFEVGDFVPYTPVGVRVPVNAYPEKFDGVVRAMKLAGVVSNGMLNSEYELGISSDHSKIMILKGDNLKPGMSLAEALDLDDYIFEIENKSLTNRGDCFSIVGIARDASAIFNLDFKPPKFFDYSLDYIKNSLDKGDKKVKLNVNIHDNHACTRYSAIVVDNVKIKESPLWLKVKLSKHGIKPINNVVDITNYILLEFGQPLHAFDFDKIAKGDSLNINVRFAKEGEFIDALDNKNHKLDSSILVIADDSKPIAIAGIIGGSNSAIDSDTKRVVIESANFNLYTIRKASMKLGIFTDASAVFSRKQDPNKTMQALFRAVELLKEYADAVVSSNLVDEYPNVLEPWYIKTTFTDIKNFVDKSIENDVVVKILTKLGISVDINGDELTLLIPTYRPDLTIPEDIFEEIARIYGYQNILQELPKRGVYPVPYTKDERTMNLIRNYFTSTGLYEIINFNFVNADIYNKANVDTDDMYKIVNAISPDVEYVRKLLLPSLIKNVEVNQKNFEKIGIFETGKVFRQSLRYDNSSSEYPLYIPPKRFGEDEDGLPVEDKHVAGVIAFKTDDPIYYTAKLYLDGLFRRMHLKDLKYNHISEFSDKAKKQIPRWIIESLNMFKAGRVAVITLNYEDKNIYLGVLGEVSQRVLSAFNIDLDVAAFELQFHLLSELADVDYRFVAPSKYPAVIQDLCFVVDKDVSYAAVKDAIFEVNKKMSSKGYEPIIRDVMCLDIYSDNKETKQITFRITLQSYQKTLKDKDIQVWRKKIITNVSSKVGGILKQA